MRSDRLSSDIERRAHDALAMLEPAYRGQLQELVRIPSPIGAEGDAQTAVARSMRSLGLAVDVFDIDVDRLRSVPGFNATERGYRDRPCVVGVLKGTGGGRSLILNAHIDTAPVDNAASWSRAPFSGDIEDGRLYGRGSWDDKAGCVECLMVVDAIRTAGARLAGDLIVKIVVEDEVTGNGTLACLARGYTADAAIIVDGTWPERFIVSHMGQLWFRVIVPGEPGPASRATNPVRAVPAVIAALQRLVDAKNGRDPRPWGTRERPVFVNIGRVRAGEWPGATPAACVLECQYGFVPPDDTEAARRDVAGAIDAASRSAEWAAAGPAAVDFFGLETPPLVGDPANPVVRQISAAMERLHAGTLVENVIAGHCDLRHYASNPWRPSIPACLYGPGGGRNPHGTDEYFLLEHLPLVARILASTALAWCG